MSRFGVGLCMVGLVCFSVCGNGLFAEPLSVTTRIDNSIFGPLYNKEIEELTVSAAEGYVDGGRLVVPAGSMVRSQTRPMNYAPYPEPYYTGLHFGATLNQDTSSSRRSFWLRLKRPTFEIHIGVAMRDVFDAIKTIDTRRSYMNFYLAENSPDIAWLWNAEHPLRRVFLDRPSSSQWYLNVRNGISPPEYTSGGGTRPLLNDMLRRGGGHDSPHRNFPGR